MYDLFRAAWRIIRNPSNNTSQVALAVAVIVAASGIGMVCALLFGVSARPGGVASRLAGGLLALLACFGAFSAGGMLGLLFGSPNWGGAGQAGQVPSNASASANGTRAGMRPNTSLERIADWLTTMIVGLSLVNLKEIEVRFTSLGIWLTAAIADDPRTTNGTAGVVIVVTYAFLGFLLVYLWAMRFLPSELRGLYEDLRERIDTVEEKSAAWLAAFRRNAVFGVPPRALETVDTELEGLGVDVDTRKEILARYRTAKTADDEPMKDFGKRDEAGYALSAQVTQIGPTKFSLTVRLTTPSTAIGGKVYWLMHNSFAPTVGYICPVEANGATFETTVDEAFWVGAVVPVSGAPALRLAMWLGDAEGVVAAFLPPASTPAPTPQP